MTPLAALPPYLRDLLQALQAPASCARFSTAQWDRVLRAGHAARLLGTLATRLQPVIGLDTLDPAARRLLRAALVEADFRRQKVRHVLAVIEPMVVGAGAPAILLKGAAYLTQNQPFAQGRLTSDVDLMVPHHALARIEQAVRDAGWQYEDDLSPYDQRYYRAWSHELPPLRIAGIPIELDLHHTILPPLGRLKPDTQALFAAAAPLAGTPFSTLAPADQTLHAVVHLFQDSDCTGRLRDLVDIDSLVRAFAAADNDYWRQLEAHARRHHLGRPLWYALAFARTWLGTPVPDEAQRWLAGFRPNPLVESVMTRLVTLALPPVDPDGEATWPRIRASQLLLARTTWLRMPPTMVAWHGLHKLGQALVARVPARTARA